MHACCEEILEKKKRSLSLETAAFDSLKSISGTCVSPPVLFDTVNEDPDDLPTVNSQCFFLTYSFVVISYFLYILQMCGSRFLDAFAKLRKKNDC